jgi:EAL domain-containing protein (putative c-di-GMP-specific phosphodiesterase class I)
LKVAVNVSGKQLEKSDFLALVLAILKKFQVSPSSLFLELTESSIIEGKSGVLATLEKLQRAGIRIALDDFGTGYSSLSYLRKLPIDILKIDRSFIQGLGEQNNNILLSSIITMAQALGLDVVAEGVEEQGQFAFLKKEGCNSIQGYLFSRPESKIKITAKLLSEELIVSDNR